MSFIENIISKAKLNKKTIVLPEANDIRTLEATAKILSENIADVVLIGNRDDIFKLAWNLDISWATIIDPISSDKYDSYVNFFYESRKEKWVTLDQAKETMLNPLYFWVMMVKMDDAHWMVAWAINSTANTLRPALQIIKTAPDTKLVSSFFVMEVPNKQYGENGLFVFTDCGIVENPTADQLSEIAISWAKSFKSLVWDTPKIAMLSYSTYGSAKSEMTEKVKEATLLAKTKAPELNIDWEMQADAAIVASVGKLKAPTSSVAGEANVLVFPDLNSGNISYKLVQRLANANAYWPMTQWLAKPVNDLSRWCSSDDIVWVVAITCVQAQI